MWDYPSSNWIHRLLSVGDFLEKKWKKKTRNTFEQQEHLNNELHFKSCGSLVYRETKLGPRRERKLKMCCFSPRNETLKKIYLIIYWCRLEELKHTDLISNQLKASFIDWFRPGLQMPAGVEGPSSVGLSHLRSTGASRGWHFPRWVCQICPRTSRTLWRASTAGACSLPARRTEAWRSRASRVLGPPPPGTWSWRLKTDPAEGSDSDWH